MDVGKELKLSVHEFFKVPEFVADVIKDTVEPALKEVIAESETKIDDFAFSVIAPYLPALEDKLIQKLKERWDAMLLEVPGGAANGGEPV